MAARSFKKERTYLCLKCYAKGMCAAAATQPIPDTYHGGRRSTTEETRARRVNLLIISDTMPLVGTRLAEFRIVFLSSFFVVFLFFFFFFSL